MNTEKRKIEWQPNARRPVDLTEIGKLLAEALSLRQTARRMSVGYGTVHKAVRDARCRSTVIENSKAAAS